MSFRVQCLREGFVKTFPLHADDSQYMIYCMYVSACMGSLLSARDRLLTCDLMIIYILLVTYRYQARNIINTYKMLPNWVIT